MACRAAPDGPPAARAGGETRSPVQRDSAAAAADGAGDETARSGRADEGLDASALARVAIRHEAWPSGRVLHETHSSIWREPVAAGSLMKLATIVGAIDMARVDPGIRFTCRRRERVGGRVLDCVHPPVSASFTLAGALAHSCNSVFLQLAERLTKSDLEAGLTRLGIAAGVHGDAVGLAAIGVDGVAVAPGDWARAIVRVARGEARISPAARAVLLEGLAAAASEGTAMSVGEVLPGALAKTSTVPLADGSVRATVAVVWPGDAPRHSLVMAAAGVSGRDAADLAAAWLRREGLAGDVVAAGARAGSNPPPSSVVRVGRASASGYRVESLPLEDYVAAVVGGEAPRRAPAALYEAMAIVARTFARAHGTRHAREGFDVCDLTHCQVLGTARAETREAAARTRGQVLVETGRPVRVYYHASCAGWLESPEHVWPARGGPGQGVGAARRDPAPHPVETWTTEASAEDLERALRTLGLEGRVEGLDVVRAATGRVERVRVRGMHPPEVGGEPFRAAIGRTLGWQVLKSPYFAATPTSRGVRFSGAGRGHGVGLCVRGALALAEAGRSAREILAAYLPGASVESLDGSSKAFTLELPATAEPERERLERLVQRLLGELGERLGTGPPDTLTIRVHPTHESFRRATGQAPWVSGVTEGTLTVRNGVRTTEARVHLMPLALLERRGEFEETLRHELAHALTGPELAGRPRWVHEGLAAWATGDPPAASGARCPSDREFETASSSAALGRLYARAAGCVADAIARGIDWRDIGR